jgi:hypothetical protein
MQAPAQCLHIVAMGSISALSNGETNYFESPALIFCHKRVKREGRWERIKIV